MVSFTKCSLVYFSPTFTTKKVLWSLAMAMKLNLPTAQYNLSIPAEREKVCHFLKDEVVFFGMPSYQGRVPMVSPEMFENISGDGTSAILLCVCGNEGVLDTLIEMRDVLSAKGFAIIAAAAVNAGQVADGASAAGVEMIQGFADKIADKLSKGQGSSLLEVPGQFPYKEVIKNNVAPYTNERCIYCMNCCRWCPTGAIAMDNPKKTDGNKCIACMSCIKRCPVGAKEFLEPVAQYTAANVSQGLSGGHLNSQLFI